MCVRDRHPQPARSSKIPLCLEAQRLEAGIREPRGMFPIFLALRMLLELLVTVMRFRYFVRHQMIRRFPDKTIELMVGEIRGEINDDRFVRTRMPHETKDIVRPVC